MVTPSGQPFEPLELVLVLDKLEFVPELELSVLELELLLPLDPDEPLLPLEPEGLLLPLDPDELLPMLDELLLRLELDDGLPLLDEASEELPLELPPLEPEAPELLLDDGEPEELLESEEPLLELPGEPELDELLLGLTTPIMTTTPPRKLRHSKIIMVFCLFGYCYAQPSLCILSAFPPPPVNNRIRALFCCQTDMLLCLDPSG